MALFPHAHDLIEGFRILIVCGAKHRTQSKFELVLRKPRGETSAASHPEEERKPQLLSASPPAARVDLIKAGETYRSVIVSLSRKGEVSHPQKWWGNRGV